MNNKINKEMETIRERKRIPKSIISVACESKIINKLPNELRYALKERNTYYTYDGDSRCGLYFNEGK